MRCFSQVRFFCSYFSNRTGGLLCIAEKDEDAQKYISAGGKPFFLCMGRTSLCILNDWIDFV